MSSGQIEQVTAGGENYDGRRPCRFEWIQKLHDECASWNVSFSFIETGTVFIKGSKRYTLAGKRMQSRMAFRSGMSFRGKPVQFHLTDTLGFPIPPEDLYQPQFHSPCRDCGSRLICNGCVRCRQCIQNDDRKNHRRQSV